MNSTPSLFNSTVGFSLGALQDEARHLIDRGFLSRRQPIYTLCRCFPARDWIGLEQELERSGYLLRDRVGDLIGPEHWQSD